jgi:hypothetical protein
MYILYKVGTKNCKKTYFLLLSIGMDIDIDKHNYNYFLYFKTRDLTFLDMNLYLDKKLNHLFRNGESTLIDPPIN